MEATAAAPTKTIKDELDQAAAAIKRGEIAQGKARLDWVLSRNPDNILAWLWMSRCARKRADAIRCFYQILSLEPGNPHALEGLKKWNAPVPRTAGSATTSSVTNPGVASLAAPAIAPTARVERPSRARHAGESTRRMARGRNHNSLLIAVGAIAAIVATVYMLQNPSKFGLGGGAIVVLFLLLSLIRGVAEREMRHQGKRERHAIRGAEGEEEVGRLLSTLGDDFVVIHDVDSPYGNIDHAVISRSKGLFLLETKAHGGRVEVSDGELLLNGKPPEKDFIGQALRNLYWLRDEIAQVIGVVPYIGAILVFTNAFVPRTPPIKGVRILNKRFLLRELQGRGRQSDIDARIWASRGQIEDLLVSGMG